MSSPEPFRINLDAYFQRIGFNGEPKADFDTLHRLHIAHATRIPFENIDPLLGRPVRMDLESVSRKLIENGRGGYCFEQNTLFAAVLEQLGFSVVRLAARVHVNTNRVLPRTHVLLSVEADGRTWLCDVGFGTWGPLAPIELKANSESQQGDWLLRVRESEGLFILEAPQCPVGPRLYSFNLEPQLPVDFEPANHYCSTHPQSRFVLTLTAQRSGLNERFLLRNREFIIGRAAGNESRMVETETELRELLANHFGIHLPPDTPSLLDRIDRNQL